MNYHSFFSKALIFRASGYGQKKNCPVPENVTPGNRTGFIIAEVSRDTDLPPLKEF